MVTRQIKTQSGTYTVHLDRSEKDVPFTLFLHGGPGFNCHAERMVLGPAFRARLNFLWFDHLGCPGSPAVSPEAITWDRQIEDIIEVTRAFTSDPVHVIGHCLGAQLTHDLVRKDPRFVKSAVWYAPVNRVSDVFKTVLRRSLSEGRLSYTDLSQQEVADVEAFLATPEEKFGAQQMMVLLQLAGNIRDFQELYWSDFDAMRNYLQMIVDRPLVIDVFARLMIQYFERGPLPFPSYEGIPVLALYSDNDKITPWEHHGREVLARIPHARALQVPGACHWMQFQNPGECARHTLEFLSSQT